MKACSLYLFEEGIWCVWSEKEGVSPSSDVRLKPYVLEVLVSPTSVGGSQLSHTGEWQGVIAVVPVYVSSVN